MRASLLLFIFLSFTTFLNHKARATPTGAVVKQLSTLLKWAKSTPKITHNGDGEVLQFENGYFVETLVEGNKLGVIPHTIRVSPEGELFAVDSNSNNIVRITPPLSQYSRARLVAGSFQGYSGHVDGKPSDARFYHPKGVTMDDKGNVYVADTSNLAIRKISESGVTTIAGGKSNVAGYRDGPSEDAQFSTDFDVVYIGRTCSLLVVDRGNAALRQISLQQEDCQYQYSSIATSDIVIVLGAVLAGYISCLVQHGFGTSNTQKSQPSKSKKHEGIPAEKKTTFVVESLKEEPSAGWPSFGRLVMDLSKFSIESIGSMLLNLIPVGLRYRQRAGLTPLKDRLVMPEDKAEPPLMQTPLVQKQIGQPTMPAMVHESNRLEPNISGDSSQKPHKSSKTHKLKDPSLSSKHRSSKRQEYGDMYSSTEAQLSSKSQKDRVRHRHREKSGENVFAAVGTEPKPVKPVEYSDPKFDHYNIRSKYATDNAFRY